MEGDVGEWILLNFWPSMFGARVKIALAEKGIKYEYREEDLSSQIKSPLLLEMNPIQKKIPVLIHNNKPICESCIIVQYIDEVCNHHPLLLPSHPYHRAQARFWADFVDNKVQPAGRKTVWHKNKEELEEGRKELIECLKLLESEALGDEKPYFGGERLGYLDVVVGGYCNWFAVYEAIANINIEAECPKLMAWANRCMKRESFAVSLIDSHKILDFIMQVKNKFGPVN
ncbi:glutathione S-transferase TAU 19 [Perilla frutescens var. hirtella]|uniref:Glutathione S-transferase n=1 Tax=Perilla frutescens var. hirtella TaxID=608512 RepID=A0AAD4PFK7_PERFH|nr:glutathione S-transferase TAU 19 [Perilla frutescens var. hirtella]